jgi:hypothetical protein
MFNKRVPKPYQSIKMNSYKSLSEVSPVCRMKRSFIMKSGICIVAFIILAGEIGFSQAVTSAKKSTARLDPKKGYITVNEMTYGLGLSSTNVPYSNNYLGFTTIQGYQINKNFMFGAGAGFFIYDAGKAAPLFLNFQYRFYTTKSLTSYASAEGGFLFKFGGEKTATDLFINPIIGVRHDFSRDVAGNIGIGMMVQQGSNRNSFIDIKVGVTIKPRF